MIEFNNVTKTYKNGVTALNSFNLRIQDGEFCFIVGRSGSGKSTLVRLLTKELDPDEGYIVVNDTDLTHLRRRHIPKYRRRLGVVFQDFRLLEDRSVYENIAFAQLIIGKTNAEIEENVSRIMELTGLSSKSRSYPRQLSGGEQQRTAIARALVNRPEILIADEPTGNLDHENALEIMHLLERINAQGTTVIVITHDREMVNRMKKRTVRMSLGEIISDTVPEESGTTEIRVGVSAVAAENAEINTDTNSDSNTEKAGEPKPGDRSKESIEKSSEEDYEENAFETSDDTSEDDFDEHYEEPEEGCNWEDDWDEDWAEPETAESQPERSTDTVNVPDKQPDTSDDAIDVSDKQPDSEIRPSAGKASDSSNETEQPADGSVEDHSVSSKSGYYMPEIKPNPTEKPRRGLKGSHRPHHKIGKEDA
ncbi:cell division ATP-binding protein FtsE [Oribacterium sp. KHPX15]|nr:cell division ATP-binding protein FtsE [Oribacterium sp. KHPX15]SEA23486.1 cell division ATP-binding protein FtsE [Oribacterium sp. KHPX15]